MTNQQLKILVVDDEPDIRESLTVRLEAENFCVVTAENGKQAYDLAGSVLPDCIILDLDMPILDGIDTLKHLREDEITAHIPVIILSASSDICDKLITRNYGVEGYAIKPFDMKHLLEKMHELSGALI